jgi:hypothetical protein
MPGSFWQFTFFLKRQADGILPVGRALFLARLIVGDRQEWPSYDGQADILALPLATQNRGPEAFCWV